MRHYLVENQHLFHNEDLLKLSTTVMKNKEDIQDMKETMATKVDINKIMDNFIDEERIKEKIFLDGQIFDAVEAYVEIYKKAKKSIFIIDDYININTLRLLKHKQKDVNVIIFTSNKSNDKVTRFEVDKFNKQYEIR